MKEIGGYFQLDQFVRNEYYPDLISLNTGRNAVIYFMEVNNIQKLYIPYFICDSIENKLIEKNYNYEKYYIDDNFQPILDIELKDSEFILIINYFGQLDDTNILKLKRFYKNIIMDNTQAFFQMPIADIDTFYSCRKFLGVPDGAYLQSKDSTLFNELDYDYSSPRMNHILGRYEKEASEYYNDFKENDKLFKDENMKKMSLLTKNILNGIDYKSVIIKRNKNFEILNESFKSYNKLKIKKPFVAFSYPLYCENGLEVKSKLAKKKIYIPTLWPNVLHSMPENSLEYKFAANILPLPCDQRYNIDDMKYLIETILRL